MTSDLPARTLRARILGAVALGEKVKRREAIMRLLQGGATEGERAAARAALDRIDGRKP